MSYLLLCSSAVRKSNQVAELITFFIDSHRVRMRGFIEKVLAMAQDVKTHPFHFLSFRREVGPPTHVLRDFLIQVANRGRLHISQSNTRLPSEISVLRFSIEKGAHCFLHFLLNPEVSPGRYKLLSEKMTQQITVIPIEGMFIDVVMFYKSTDLIRRMRK